MTTNTFCTVTGCIIVIIALMERRTKNMFRCLLYFLVTTAILHVVTAGCSLAVNRDLGQPQPIYLKDNAYLEPSDNSGYIHLKQGDEVRLACVGPHRVISHPLLLQSLNTLDVTCVKDQLFSNPTYLSENVRFRQLVCTQYLSHNSRSMPDTCYGGNTLIQVGYIVNKVMYPVYTSCFDKDRLEVLYVKYELGPKNMGFQHIVETVKWEWDNVLFKNLHMDKLYRVASHKDAMWKLVGSRTNQYIIGDQILTRGHLGAKKDFILATMQHATYDFVNIAPQFHTINNGNWESLERNLRQHIRKSGYKTKIYTGTFGVTQLRNERGVLTDIYLHERVIPVPLYFFKVVHDVKRNLATAFVSINNPYYSDNEIKKLVFCKDVCRGDVKFSWLTWEPDNKLLGYSFCCNMEDFKKSIKYIPITRVKGLLT